MLSMDSGWELVDRDEIRPTTTRHFIALHKRDTCKSCRVSFNTFAGHRGTRARNCWRCGEVFCQKCSQFKTRLSPNAFPDPGGKMFTVCKKCFHEPQTIGVCRDWSDHFHAVKEHLQRIKDTSAAADAKSRRRKINVDMECQRLVDGFHASAMDNRNTSPLFFSIFSKARWKDSNFKVAKTKVTFCQNCRSQFTINLSKKNCCVCGSVVCRSCSSNDLIVYIDDEEEKEAEGDLENVDAKLAIIRVVGAPFKEPNLSVNLWVCLLCKSQIEDKQVNEYYEDSTEKDQSVAKLIQIHKRLSALRRKIDSRLLKYQELTQSLAGDSSGVSPVLSNSQSPGKANEKHVGIGHRSNIQVLAKARADLADYFLNLFADVQSLKRLIIGSSGMHSVLIKQVIRGNAIFFQETKYVYKEVGERLDEFTPREVLEMIQEVVDQKAILSAYLCLKQLGLELLALCDKCRIEDATPASIIAIAMVDVEEEFQRSTGKEGSMWEAQENDTMEFLRHQIKGKHRLLRPSRELLRFGAAVEAERMLLRRSHKIVTEIIYQLEGRCAESKFSKTRQALMKALREVENAQSR